MSQLEVSSYELYSANFTLTDGLIAAAATANFDGSSKLLSIVRKVAAGTAPGTPHAIVVSPTAAGAANSVWKLGVASSTAVAGADASTYTVYWVNQYQASPNYLQAGATAGVQFAP